MRNILICGDSNAISLRNFEMNNFDGIEKNKYYEDISNVSKPGEINYLEFVNNVDGIKLNIIVFNGATAKGLNKKNSTINQSKIIKDKIQELGEVQIIYAFGLVDVDFVYWYKISEGYIDFDKYVENAVEKYIEGIKQIQIGYVFDITPPTVEDEHMMDFVKVHFEKLYNKIKTNNIEKAIKTLPYLSYKVRWIFHEKFNSFLDFVCERENIKVIKHWDKFKENGNNKVKDMCKNKELKTDHHIEIDELGRIWGETIKDIILKVNIW